MCNTLFQLIHGIFNHILPAGRYVKDIYLLFALLFILFQLAVYLFHENHRDQMKEAGGHWVWAVQGQ